MPGSKTPGCPAPRSTADQDASTNIFLPVMVDLPQAAARKPSPRRLDARRVARVPRAKERASRAAARSASASTSSVVEPGGSPAARACRPPAPPGRRRNGTAGADRARAHRSECPTRAASTSGNTGTRRPGRPDLRLPQAQSTTAGDGWAVLILRDPAQAHQRDAQAHSVATVTRTGSTGPGGFATAT